MASSINPAVVLKRKHSDDDDDIDYELCLICQRKSQEHLKVASEHGWQRVLSVAQEREQLNDTAYPIVIKNIHSIEHLDFSNTSLKWHKNCYSSFTAENKLQRLRNKQKTSEPSTSDSDGLSHRVSRTSVSATDWKRCIFCQSTDVDNMHRVSTMGLSDKILSHAKYDLTMRVRLADVNDLIAADGMYHLQCLVLFERKSKNICSLPDDEGRGKEMLMDSLCAELLQGLSKGNVYDMGDVWIRYNEMCKTNNIHPSDSYISRRKTFNDSVREHIGPEASFIRPLDMKASLLVYPSEKSQFLIADCLTNKKRANEESDLQDTEATNQNISLLQEMVHTALHVRSDLEKHPGHSSGWLGINESSVKDVIPNSLYLFLSILCGGVSTLDTEDLANEDAEMNRHICSIAQDIVVAVSKHRKTTPKHVALGLTLHQATRSEQLVKLFHAAGHTIGIDTVRRIDTTIANDILDKYEANGCVYLPEGIIPYKPGRLILSSCDNIDVLEETIDGKNTFHCTQMVVWQRGPAPAPQQTNAVVKIKRPKALDKKRLIQLHQLDHAHMPPGTRPSPVFGTECEIDVYSWRDKSDERTNAKQQNLAWLLIRGEDKDHRVPNWSEFNRLISDVDPPVTTVGMLPILQAPADTNDTMTTVLNKFGSISRTLGQRHTVLIADQPLYSRAKELVWANPDKYKDVVVVLGDLHICFNFLKVIGQHYDSSGLDDVWVESGLFAQNSTEAMLNGKAYYRAVRGHLWAYEALRSIWWTHFVQWLQYNSEELDGTVLTEATKVAELFEESTEDRQQDTREAVSKLLDALNSTDLQNQIERFEQQFSEEPNYKHWTNYMDMVEILLGFIRANRDGNWQLHLDSFAAMLPWMSIYDHTNYARWGPVHLAEMKCLPLTAPEVYEEFMAGHFVIKRSKNRFNQVPVDQATEWINRMCKISNGIIGITRNDSARDRFCATWAERSRISNDTKHLYGLLDDEDDEQAISTRKDSLPSKRNYDHKAVSDLKMQFERFDVFKIDIRGEVASETASGETNNDSEVATISPEHKEVPPLIALASRDVAAQDIQKELLCAERKGVTLVETFVRERLESKTVHFFAPIKKNNPKTFGTLYKCVTVSKTNEKKTLKADRRLMQQLFNASQAGRKVQISEIMKHELSPVPLSLAKLNGDMQACNKADLLNILTTEIGVSTSSLLPEPDPDIKTCVIIDGHALIQALGKPSNCRTFDDYSKEFIKIALGKLDRSVKRLDVVFDRYTGKDSIKASTRNKRAGKTKLSIRRIISDDVPLPEVWSQFISLDDNKADIARFLSHRLIAHGTRIQEQTEIITGGGFEDIQTTQSSKDGIVPQLQGDHEEADTRMIVHAVDAIAKGFKRVLVHSRDTDVLLMMIHFLCDVSADVWMVSGTARQQKNYPISKIALQLPKEVVANILGYHSLTGCDTTSAFSGRGKRSSWKIYMQHPELLQGVGRDGPAELAEEFVCRLYGSQTPSRGLDCARSAIFQKGQIALEMLPPTRDAFSLHLKRSNYQAKIWLQADKSTLAVGSPCESQGWRATDDGLCVVWTHLPPIPQACVELVACGCKTKCRTMACSCLKKEQVCTPACTCNAEQCRNPISITEDERTE